jgi:hypothetical protein
MTSSDNGGRPARADAAGYERRRFMRRIAVGGTAAWVAPAVITMRPSAAPLTSPPPGRPRDPADPADPVDPGTEVQERVVARDPAAEVEGRQITRDQLAPTGVDVEDPVIGGLAALAGGGALARWRAEQTQPASPRRSESAATDDT